MPAPGRMAERGGRPGRRLCRPRRHAPGRPTPANPSRVARTTSPTGPRRCCSWRAGPNWSPRSSVPTLESGRVVVSDRFVAANVAYQGHARGAVPRRVVGRRPVLDRGTSAGPDGHPRPSRGGRHRPPRQVRGPGRGRGLDYLDRVRRGFLAEAARRPDAVRVLDATPDVDSVQQQLRAVVRDFLGGRGYPVRGQS